MSDPSLDLDAIAERIAKQVGTATTGVNPYWSDVDNPQLPAVKVLPADEFISYFTTFGSDGFTTLNFEMTLIVPITIGAESPTKKLFSLLSVGTPDSVFSALWADATLGGSVYQAAMLGASGPRRTVVAGTEVDQVIAPVQVLVRKG